MPNIFGLYILIAFEYENNTNGIIHGKSVRRNVFRIVHKNAIRCIIGVKRQRAIAFQYTFCRRMRSIRHYGMR